MLAKKELMKDLKFCQDLMNRLVDNANNVYDADKWYQSNHTVVQTDIIRLRRELNNVRKKLEWYYGDNRL